VNCQYPVINSTYGGLILFAVTGGLMSIILIILSVVVYQRRKVQPLRLKSASLLSLVIVTNVLIVVCGTVISISTELCAYNADKCSKTLSNLTMYMGIFIMAFCEPVVLSA
jgi:amino acid transporter